MGESARSSWDRAVALGQAAAGAACVLGLHDVGSRFHSGFRIPYGVGVQSIHTDELAFYAWFTVFALAATALLAAALARTSLPERLLAAGAQAARSPALPLLAGALVAATALLVRRFVLLDAPIADDESTYAFIAQTLLHRRVVNPPPGDAPFFANQFVVLTNTAWYGKYPIGHPLLLALGELCGVRSLVVPLVTGASLWLTWAVGRRILPEREALLGAGLLLVSPQFVLTGATQLSQPTSGLCMLLGIWALLRHLDSGRLSWAVASGAAWGAGLLVRPLPGVLFLAAAAGWVLVALRHEPWPRRLRRLGAAALPVLACVGALLAVQAAQTGDATRSGYQAYHGDLTGGWLRAGWISASLAGSALRQNFWLFGWVLSFAFLPFARRSPRMNLLWALVAAEYAYRVLVPKTVVASTGPIYVAEIVPLLALATASGIAGVAERLRRAGVERASARVAAAVAAAVLVAAASFLPVQIRSLHRSGAAWQTANRLLDEAGAGPALVFADTLVEPGSGDSWAYYPPDPSPDLDDPRIFVRVPPGPEGGRIALDFWQRRFPDRSAWLFQVGERGPELRRLRRG